MSDGPEDRRDFMRSVLTWSGLGIGYAIGGVHFVRYLVPLGAKKRYREMFVGPVDDLEVGRSRLVRTPSGATYVMARTGEREFRVLSDVCPHLGCRVHFLPKEKQFLCPCHMGVFDETGRAISGPPAEAGQDLTSLETVVRGSSVYVMIEES